MLAFFKKVLFTITLNAGLFLLLIIGIQNNANRSKVKLLISETVSLPIGFIIGMSFISGSIAGSIFTVNFRQKS